ncbi:MAG: DUF4175 family protein [Robiginitalea sp.]
MDSYARILLKLQGFINRYYKRQLVKGIFLFLFFGGLLLLFIGGLEYFLWLNSGTRTLLMWLGLLLEVFLLARHVALPLLRLFRLRQGLSYKEGSRIIGIHFSDVNDKLYNLLELAENKKRTELLLASIEQRSRDLMEVPFQRAISMREAYRYARHALIPILVVLLIWLSGRGMDFFRSYERVVKYEMAFEQPAPFRFELLTPELRQREDQPFVLKLRTVGEEQPGQVKLVLNGNPLIMEDRVTHFEYTFQPPLKPAEFTFEAEGITSRMYDFEVLRIPVIDQFEMEFRYPAYLGRPDDRISGSGNATLPEGTTVTWKVSAVHTDSLLFSDQDTLLMAPSNNGEVNFSKRVWTSMNYSISASNLDVGEYDKLSYRIEAVPDEYPEIQVAMEQDSLNPNLAYFTGDLSDDYGLSKLEAVVYESGNESQEQVLDLPVPGALFHTFYYTYPSGLRVEEGKDYILFFRVQDNDGNRGGKVRKSREFRLRLLNENERDRQTLEYQQGLLRGLDKTSGEQQRLDKSFEELERLRKEKETLDFEDKQKLKDFLEKQKKQDRLMEKFSRELAESIKEGTSEEDKLLKERLERQEAQAQKNAALMEEIQKILDKLDQGAFEERMDELAKKQKGNQRSMQQLLELTKRYYVQQKSKQLSRQLKELSQEQDSISKTDLGDPGLNEEQERINKEFMDIRQGLEQLDKDNESLKKPLPWKREETKEESVQRDQKEVLDLLEKLKDAEPADEGPDKQEGAKAKEKQKGASRKMQELSEGLSQGASMGGAQSIAEDAEMLRQILDNLITFSIEQETLFNKVQDLDEGAVNYSADIRKQKELRALFEHVDDSLFALSMRRVEISELINTQITEIYYNIDKGLESIGDNNWYRGASYQQYVVTAANELSAFLADLLDNMQQSLMPGQGQGAGGDFQLPDIIQSQEQLRQRASQGQGKGAPEGSQEGNNDGESQGQEGEKTGGQSKAGSGENRGEGTGEGGTEGSEGGSGDQGDAKSGGSGGNEDSYAEYFEIYKEQQKIREQLERQLEDMINEGDRKLAESIAREMELFEEELLRNGITERTAERLNRIQQQLMRLENAALEQGEREERQSRTNTDVFDNPVLTRPEVFERKEDEIEFLNRQVLPLRRLYRERVKRYFSKSDRISLPNGL